MSTPAPSPNSDASPVPGGLSVDGDVVADRAGNADRGNVACQCRGADGVVETLKHDPHGQPLRWVDRQLLQSMSHGEAIGVDQMMSKLGVTATAIRQRIERLLEAGLIERQKVVSGRGRPSFVYQLTDRGRWCAGADPTDLAEAMWQEILELSDESLRSRLLGGVAKRLGRRFAERSEAGEGGDEAKLDERMRRLADQLAQRRIATLVVFDNQPVAGLESPVGLPVLDVPACPYPALRDATEDRSMCELEAAIFSEALGQPVRLSSCLLDGDSVCRFVPAENNDDHR
jgi:predicted ArsR family transcriptional regulator